jgi:hypothetical protein
MASRHCACALTVRIGNAGSGPGIREPKRSGKLQIGVLQTPCRRMTYRRKPHVAMEKRDTLSLNKVETSVETANIIGNIPDTRMHSKTAVRSRTIPIDDGFYRRASRTAAITKDSGN